MIDDKIERFVIVMRSLLVEWKETRGGSSEEREIERRIDCALDRYFSKEEIELLLVAHPPPNRFDLRRRPKLHTANWLLKIFEEGAAYRD